MREMSQIRNREMRGGEREDMRREKVSWGIDVTSLRREKDE